MRGDLRALATSLDVVHVDELMMTQRPIQPKELSGWPSAFHHSTTDAQTIAGAIDAIEEQHPRPEPHTEELRWQLTFRDANGSALCEIFSDSDLPYAMIDGERVRLSNDGLGQFLTREFRTAEPSLLNG